jgi:hypothetical protein
MRVWRRAVQAFVIHRVLHADDPPHRLALGAAIGMFVALTPTIGLQSGLVVMLAWLLGGNKVVGLPLVWISNPATAAPIFYGCYTVGRHVLGMKGVGRAWWAEFMHPPQGYVDAILFYWSRLADIAAPLWLGSLLVGTVLAAATYVFVYQSVSIYRRRFASRIAAAIAAAVKRK